MILDARSGLKGLLIDLQTGQPIRKVRWANLETGEYEAFRLSPAGNILHADGIPVRYRGRTRLRWIPAKPVGKSTPEPTQTITRPIPIPLFCDRCDHPGCQRIATWSVSDETIEAPVVRCGRRFSRGRVVARRYYCSWHYKPPRILDERGEVMEEIHEAGGVRPS